MNEKAIKELEELLNSYGWQSTREFLTHGEMADIISIGVMAKLDPRAVGLRLLVFGNLGSNNRKMVLDSVNQVFNELQSNRSDK